MEPYNVKNIYQRCKKVKCLRYDGYFDYTSNRTGWLIGVAIKVRYSSSVLVIRGSFS